MKIRKTLLLVLALVMVLSVALVAGCGETKVNAIYVVFDGGTPALLEEGQTATAPQVQLSGDETLVGWATSPTGDAKFGKNGAPITYEAICDYADSEGTVKLYSVKENVVTVTIKGVTEEKTVLKKSTANTATLPLVAENSRQKFLGWATTENATEYQIKADTNINYEAVKNLTTTGKLTLYPVVKTYDLLVAVHASHSNGNVYISEQQFALLKTNLEAQFSGINILLDRIDAVSAANFALAVSKKDYDITLSSKSIDGDLKAINAESGLTENTSYPMTAMNCISINQSRQVGIVKGHDDTTTYPYAVQAYNFFLTPTDETVKVTFTNGAVTDEVTIHRLVGGAISTQTYAPANNAIVAAPAGQVLYGWATTANATEAQIASVSFESASSLATDGAVTLYPVFGKTPDLYVSVWAKNGSSVYATQEEIDTAKAQFIEYAGDLAKDKFIVFEYVSGKTDEYAASINVNSHVIISGTNINTAEQCLGLLTETGVQRALVVNYTFSNANRYLGLCKIAEENALALACVDFFCKDEIEVTFSVDGKISQPQKVDSLSGNTANTEGIVNVPTGKILLGYAVTADGKDAVVTGDVKYQTVKEFAVDGKVTLYPIFDSYDLIVAVWAQNGTNEYASAAQIEAMVTAYNKARTDSALSAIKVLTLPISGGTNAYAALIPSNANVIISGKNIDTDAQCKAMLSTAEGAVRCAQVIHAEFTSTRYAGLVSGSEQNAYAKELIEFLCEEKIAVSFAGYSESNTTLSSLYGNKATAPVVTTEAGKTFTGWATTEGATEAQILAITDIDYNAVKALATENKITLYPVIVNESSLITYDLIVDVLCGKSTTETFGFITEAEVTAIAEKFVAYLAAQGDQNSANYKIQVKYLPGESGANFNASLAGNEDVLVGASNLTSQTGFPGMYGTNVWTKIINGDVIANTSRYAGIVATCNAEHLSLAEKFIAFLCDAEVEITFNGTQGTQTVTYLAGNKATAPVVTTEAGKTFLGWATTEGATEAQISTDADITYTAVKLLATNGKVTLYPVIVTSGSEVKYDLVVYVLSGNNADYDKLSKKVFDGLGDAFRAYLKGISDANADNYVFDFKPFTLKAADMNETIKGAGNVDVAIMSSAAFKDTYGFAGYYTGETNSEVTGIENDGRYAGILASCSADHYSLAQKFMAFLTTKAS